MRGFLVVVLIVGCSVPPAKEYPHKSYEVEKPPPKKAAKLIILDPNIEGTVTEVRILEE